MMRVFRFWQMTGVLPGMVFLAVLLSIVACGARSSPLVDARELHTPTPGASDTGSGQQGSGANAGGNPYDFEYKGSIKIAQWDEMSNRVVNFAAGYVLVQGMVYQVEIVEVVKEDATAELEAGNVDAVLGLDRVEASEWYDRVVDEGTVVDAGPVFTSGADVRIVVRADLQERLPEVFAFLEDYVVKEDEIDNLASRVTGGRVAITYPIAGITYLKNNEATWSEWVTPDVVAGVKKAIAENRNYLYRVCGQGGSSGNMVMVDCK